MDTPQTTAVIDEVEAGKVVNFILQNKGIDLTSYRSTFLARRLKVRMGVVRVQTFIEYTALLKKDPEELNKFLDTLGVNVTEFFRDQSVFSVFRKTPLADLIKRKESSTNRLIRIWSAACASGEETYSLAMVLREELLLKKDFSVRIWGTDMDKEALAKAALAEYKSHDLRKLDNKIVEKYFIPVYNNLYHLKDEIKQMVKFQQHNLLADAPLNFMDVIFCRNMMIYLNHDQQKLLYKKFYESLNPRGYLVIGKVENILVKDLFKEVDMREKIYQKID